jgi:hypothetical protein
VSPSRELLTEGLSLRSSVVIAESSNRSDSSRENSSRGGRGTSNRSGGRNRDVGYDGSRKRKDVGGGMRILATSCLCNDYVLHVLITYRYSGCMVDSVTSATSGGNVFSNMVPGKQ